MLAPRALARRNEVPAALHLRRHVRPARAEAERFELGGEYLADFADAFRIERAAVDVDRALEKRDRFVRARFHRGDNALLHFGERRERTRAGEKEEGG